jgi:outer membrane protein assembly factor BamE (lipoprotein component of BamABCDE complex)
MFYLLFVVKLGKIMKYIIALSFVLALVSGCKSTEKLTPVSQIKPGVAKEGTLANAKLISDAKTGLENVFGSKIKDSELLKFVIQQPVGEAGSRSWREMWIVKTPEDTTQYMMTFTESGLGAADFEIKPMEGDRNSKTCPSNIAKFPVGETTSDHVVSCMGKPQHEDYNPDGRFVYLYETEGNTILTYLFGKDKKLIKIVGYENSGN